MDWKEVVSLILIPLTLSGYVFTWVTHNRLLDLIHTLRDKLTELQFNHLSHFERRLEELERGANGRRDNN